jgi:DNA polymerase III alpha subunit (gram-positive type)
MLDKPYCEPDKKYLVYDCETCHLNLAIENYPWQHSWLVCQGNTILEEHNHYIYWPNMKVSEGAARQTRFNPEKVKELSEDPKAVLDKLMSYLYNPEYFIVIANGLRFDIFVIAQHQRYCGVKVDWSYLERVLDPVALMKGVKLNIKKSAEDSLRQYQYRLHNLRVKGIKTSVSALCKDYDILYDPLLAHDGLNDCKYLLEIWKKSRYSLDI